MLKAGNACDIILLMHANTLKDKEWRGTSSWSWIIHIDDRVNPYDTIDLVLRDQRESFCTAKQFPHCVIIDPDHVEVAKECS